MMTISTKRCIVEPGLCSTMKEGPFLEREYVKNFLLFVICSGLFFSCCCLFFFKMRGNKRRLIFMVQFTLAQFFFFFNACIVKDLDLIFLIKYKQAIFLSKVSRVICVCSTRPRRFWFVLESAAVSYSDFV